MHGISTVILFAKLPVRGRIKTRLARDLGEELALRLYESMVLDTIGTLKESGFPFRICIAPPGAVEEARTWLGSDNVFMPQTGGDLGERMEQAFVRVFSEGFREAALIGSDIPELSSGMVRETFASLAGHDAVIGPANDGGYYLIGFTRNGFCPEIFRALQWSTPDVFRETMERFASMHRHVHVLPECIDADTRSDLAMLLRRRNALTASSRTLSLLMQHRRSLAE